MDEIKKLLEEQGDAFEAFVAKNSDAFAAEKKAREELELKLNRLGVGYSGEPRRAGVSKAMGNAFRKFISLGDDTEIKGMATSADADGGYMVLPEFSSELTRKVFDLSPIRQIARNVDISSDAFEEVVDWNEASASWVGETQARSDTDHPQIGKLRIPVYEIYAMPKISQRLLDDAAFDVGSWLVEKVADKFARAEGAAFISGTDVTQPKGFLSETINSTSDGSRAYGAIQYLPTGAAANFHATLPGDVFFDAIAALKTAYRPNARWVMNRATQGLVRKFKEATTNGYIWQQGDFAGGVPDRLCGYPITLAEDMPSVGANTYPVAFGDFSKAYTVVNRLGVRLLRDPYTDKPNVRFYMFYRTGGLTTNTEAVKVIKCATS